MLKSHTRTEEQWAPFPLKMLTQYCSALIRFSSPKCRRLQDFCVIWPMLWPLWMECANNAGLADQSLPRPPPLKQRHYVTAALRWPCLHTVHCKLNCSTILGQIYPAGCTTIVLYTELSVVRGSSKRMELCHCKGRIREFVTLEMRSIRGWDSTSQVLCFNNISNAPLFRDWVK